MTKQLHKIPFIAEMMQTTRDMWRFGWDERNAGNISYRINAETVREHLGDCATLRTLPLQIAVPQLAGMFFAVTGSGKYFKNAIFQPETDLGLIRVQPDGTAIDILWGLADGSNPTSELPAHFLSHSERLAVDPDHRVIMHSHATNTMAMSYTHELDENRFTKTLWQMCTECLVVFPEGVGVIPWLIPGSDALAYATAQKMREFRTVIWPKHGIIGSGRTMDEAFGLIETVEKSAQIYMLASAHKTGILNVISDENLLQLAKSFNVHPRKGII